MPSEMTFGVKWTLIIRASKVSLLYLIIYIWWICIYLPMCRNIRDVFNRSLWVLCWVVMTSKWCKLFCAFILLWFHKTLLIWTRYIGWGSIQRNKKFLEPKITNRLFIGQCTLQSTKHLCFRVNPELVTEVACSNFSYI